MSWDTSVPSDPSAANLGANVIRTLKSDLQSALRGQTTEGSEAVFPGSDTANPVFRYRGLRGTTGSRPAAANYGLYFDTDRQALQRSTGGAWEDVGVAISVNTRMVFAQSVVPTGWTLVTTWNDRALRVVSGTGGSTGGSTGLSSGITLAHSHTVNAHTHTISSDGGHTHTTTHTHAISSAAVDHKHLTPTIKDSSTTQVYGVGEDPFGNGGDATGVAIGTFAARVGVQPNKVFQKTDVMTNFAGGNTNSTAAASDSQGAHTHGAATGSASPSTDSQLSSITLSYLDVVIGQKS